MGSCDNCQVVEYTAVRMRFRTRSNWPLSGSCVGAAVVLGCAVVVVVVVVTTVVATVVVDVSVVGRIDVTHAPLPLVLLSVLFNATVTQPLLLLLVSVALGWTETVTVTVMLPLSVAVGAIVEGIRVVLVVVVVGGARTAADVVAVEVSALELADLS
jgi:hypothetical protein